MYCIVCKYFMFQPSPLNMNGFDMAITFYHIIIQTMELMIVKERSLSINYRYYGAIASPLVTTSIQYIINVALTPPATLYLDRWGKRPSVLIGSFFIWSSFSLRVLCMPSMDSLILMQRERLRTAI